MKRTFYSIIKNQEQYEQYCNRLENLVESGENRHEDEVELLSLLIEKYNEEQMARYEMELNPVELLADLLTENKLSQVELSRKTGISPQLINDILKYRREITKNTALKLGETFKIKYYAFLKPYELRKAI